jgi:integrase
LKPFRADSEANKPSGVRDAKHPTDKDGNHRRFKYTPEAWALVAAQPRTSDHIFPYDRKSAGAAFMRACHILGIQDLRFHDLRHEATSRLFECGYQIHKVAQFTLHESWDDLKCYTNLKPENLRDISPPTAGGARAPSRKSSRIANRRSRAAHQSAQRHLWH